MPVSAAVGQALKEGRKGDSTGCGDNFAGGVIGSLARQIYNCHLSTVTSQLSPLNCQLSPLNLIEATRWGIVSGGFACFYYGGTSIEKQEGEKLTLLQELYNQYLTQTQSSR